MSDTSQNNNGTIAKANGKMDARQSLNLAVERDEKGSQFLNWQSILLPALFVAALFAFLVTAYFQLQETNRNIQTGGLESPAWQLNQVQVKLLRFINVLDRVFLPENAEIGFVEVQDSYEQLLVDIDRALDRVNDTSIQLVSAANTSLNALRGDLVSIQSTVRTLEVTPYQEVSAIRLRMEGHATRIQRLPKEALEIQAERMTLVQKRVRSLTTQIVIYLLVILLIAAILVYFLVGLQRKAVAFQNYLITALDTIPDAFALFDERDRLTVTNERFRQEFGLSKRDLATPLTFRNLLERGVESGLYPASSGDAQEWIRDRISKHKVPELAFEEPFSQDRWVRVAERRTSRGETALIQADITELKNRETELFRSRSRFQRLVDTSFEGILVVQDEKIISANKRLAEVLGFDSHELNGQSFTEILDVVRSNTSSIDGAARNAGWETLLNQPEADVVEVAATRKNGDEIFLEASVRTFAVEGGQEKVWAIRDITERREQQGALRRAKDAAEQGSRAKSDFLAMMSHEIRTPMNAVLGMTNLLLDTKLNDRQHYYAATVRDSADGLLTILNDMLDLTKLEAGKLQMERVAFDFDQLVQGIVDLMTPNAAEKDLLLSADLSRLQQKYLIGDPQRLRQVILNLIGNAVKFTEFGNVRVLVDQDIAQHQPGDTPKVSVRVSVIDTGIGISQDKIDQLFIPFTQAEADISRRFGGTGLGLAICKRIIEQMDGEITVLSTQGAGSTFFFSVDLSVASKDEVEDLETLLSAAQPPLQFRAPEAPIQIDLEPDEAYGFGLGHGLTKTPGGAAPMAQPRVLVVEDSPTNQAVVAAFLEKSPYKLTMAENGLQAVQKVQEQTFDAILMDLSMPVMDGIEATRQIRQLGGAFTQLPIIALTANAMPDDQRRCFDAGMDDYLSKPIDLRLLLEKLKTWAMPDEQAAPQPISEEEDDTGQDDDSGPIVRIGGDRPRDDINLDTDTDEAPQPGLGQRQENVLFSNQTMEDLEAAQSQDHDLSAIELVSQEVLDQLTQDTGPDIVAMLVGSYLAELGGHVQALNQGVEALDAEQVKHRAHTIKGSSATFGAMHLSALAKAIETSATQNDWNRTVELSDRITDAATQTESLLKAILEI